MPEPKRRSVRCLVYARRMHTLSQEMQDLWLCPVQLEHALVRWILRPGQWHCISRVLQNWVRQALTALTVSAIFDMHMNTASLRRQNAATVNLLSTSLNFAEVFSTPISYSFDSSWSSIRDRNGSWAGSSDMRCAKDLNEPHNLLYLCNSRLLLLNSIVNKLTHTYDSPLGLVCGIFA